MPLWYTLKQFAVASQMSTNTVRTKIKNGEIPAIRTVRGFRIPDPGPQMWARLQQPLHALDLQLILRVTEVAGVLGTTNNNVKKLRRRGMLPGTKIGRCYYWSLAELLEYLTKRNARRRGIKQLSWTKNHSRIELINWGRKRVEALMYRLESEDSELPLPPLEDFERYIERMAKAPEPLRSTQLRCLLEMSEEWSRILRILLQPHSAVAPSPPPSGGGVIHC